MKKKLCEKKSKKRKNLFHETKRKEIIKLMRKKRHACAYIDVYCGHRTAYSLAKIDW